jgi:threonine/homoserine/homoserine lactone efflux protein
MPKALSMMGMLIAVLILLIFALDLALGIPFGGTKASGTMDILMVLGGAVLGYLSWAAFREQA